MTSINEWTFEPWPVHGGWRVARVRWFIDRRGEKDHEHEFEGDFVFPDERSCAIAVRHLIKRGVSAQP